MKKYMYLDIETTGLDVMKDRIVQLFVESSNGDKLDLIINPGIPSSPEALSKHGFTEEYLSDKPKLIDLLDRILEFFNTHNSDEYYLVGHNVGRFDLQLLMNDLLRVNPSIDFDLFNYVILDTLDIERKLYPMDLNSVYKRYNGGSEIESYHNAVADVKATKFIHENQSNSKLYDEDKMKKVIFDPENRIWYNDQGIPVWGNFGKYKYKNTNIYNDLEYLKWFLSLDNIPNSVKHTIMNNKDKYLTKL